MSGLREVLCALMIIATPWVAGEAKEASDVRIDYGKPRALLVAYRHYPQFPVHRRKLVYTLSSAGLLAKHLIANGHEVTIITDGGERDALAGVNVEVIEKSEELSKRIKDWVLRHFEGKPDRPVADRAPFGLLLFTGHGERRGTDDVFLTSLDRPGTGGISMRDLRNIAGDRRLPVYVVFDACREYAAPTAASPAGIWSRPSEVGLAKLVGEARGNPTGVRLSNRAVSLEKSHELALTLFSTQPGQVCPDLEWNLTRGLADGLKHLEDPATFLAARSIPLSLKRVGSGVNAEDLCLLAWFKFAISQIGHGEDDNTQSPDLQRGWIDQSMIVASRRKGFRFTPPPIDLSSTWTSESFAKGTSVSAKSHPMGVAFVPSGGKTRFAVAFLDGQFDLRNKTLLVELFAPGSENSLKEVTICLRPGNNATGQLFNSNSRQPYTIPRNRFHQVLIPLDDAPATPTILSLAISADENNMGGWPPGSMIVIKRVVLVDNEGLKELSDDRELPGLQELDDQPAKSAVDLLPSWWASDPLPLAGRNDMDGQIRFDGAKLCLTLQKIGDADRPSIGWGGPLFPELYLDHGRYSMELMIEALEPMAADKCQLIFRVEGFHAKTGQSTALVSRTETISRESVGIPVRLPVTASGFVDYVAVQSNATRLKISSLRLVPKRSAKK